MLKSSTKTIKNGINIEIGNQCKVRCKACPRQLNRKNLIGSYSIPFDDLKIIFDTFRRSHLSFCGQMADPIYHPDFIKIVEYLDKNTGVIFHTNGHGFDKEWWTNIFNIAKHKRMGFIFGVDGLPKDSHKYRVGQDGEQVWEMMKLGAAMGVRIEWQYIVFNYNENDIDEARLMAKEHNIKFIEMHSNRFQKIPEMKPTAMDKRVE